MVDELRAKKSAAEVALLRRAAEISSEGHRAAMLAPMPQHEYDLQAVLEYNFTRLGGTRPPQIAPTACCDGSLASPSG